MPTMFVEQDQNVEKRYTDVRFPYLSLNYNININIQIGLIKVFGAILMSRQGGQKLQCLYGNPMANNFFQNRILRNLSIAVLKY